MDSKESFSKRAMPENTLGSTAVNDVEARKLAGVKQEIKDISFGEGKRDVQRLK